MTLLRLAALAIVLLAALPGSASAALTASGVRVGAQAAFVRVVVDFSGGTVSLNEVDATDPKPADGAARVVIAHRGIAVRPADVSGFGVRARMSRAGANSVRVQLTVTPGKFKYVRVSALASPQRLLIDVYRTAPPSAGAEIRTGVGKCLTLTSVQGSGSSFVVKGTELNVFEGSFVIRVRAATGKVVGTRIVTARGDWSQTVRYDVARAQSGTVEAVAASAKDGSLACLVQVRVRLSG